MEKIAKKITHWIGTSSAIYTHLSFFTIMGLWYLFDVPDRDRILLILTTIVSLEAVFQGCFIQMTVNLQGRELNAVKTTMNEVQESVESVQTSVEEVQESVESVQETVEEVHEEVHAEEQIG